MDLGGASTQITFETASPAEDPANEVQLRLYGQQHRVYTHSFLCYGRDQVLQKLLALALQVPAGPAHRHRCALRGRGGAKDTVWSPGGSSAQDGFSRQQGPVSCHWLEGQEGRDPAGARAPWLEVDLASAGEG